MVKANVLGDIIYQVFKKYGGISSYKTSGLGWLLLKALNDLGKGNRRTK